jgi:hypothetical protein
VYGIKIQTFHLLTNLIRKSVAITCESIPSLGQLLKTHKKLVFYFANCMFVGLVNIIYCIYSLYTEGKLLPHAIRKQVYITCKSQSSPGQPLKFHKGVEIATITALVHG